MRPSPASGPPLVPPRRADATTRFYLTAEGEDGAIELKADWPSREVAGLAAGDTVHVGVDARDAHVFPAATRPAATRPAA